MAKPRLMPPVPDNSGGITRDTAARILDVSPSKVGWLIATKHLAPSSRGVTRRSVEAEKRWRATASPDEKAQRALRDAWTVISGIWELISVFS